MGMQPERESSEYGYESSNSVLDPFDLASECSSQALDEKPRQKDDKEKEDEQSDEESEDDESEDTENVSETVAQNLCEGT